MQVCIEERNLIIILVLILSFGSFIFYKKESFTSIVAPNSSELDRMYALLKQCISSNEQLTKQNLQNQSHLGNLSNGNKYLDKIYNPLYPPENVYNTGYSYQQLGFVFLDNERYPLFGRNKYNSKSDKKEYYILDESRNHLKIPFKSPNDNELYDGDKIFINLLNKEFNVKIYDTEEIRYNPGF
jgi:hypothetical protein